MPQWSAVNVKNSFKGHMFETSLILVHDLISSREESITLKIANKLYSGPLLE